MPIVIQSNFSLQQAAPIDTRLVATSSTQLNDIVYKYVGLRVYRTDIQRSFTWDGTQWQVDGSGIYGGSGSLVGDTEANFGTVSNTVGSQSNILTYRSDTSASTQTYLYNSFVRHTGLGGAENVEFRQQLNYLDSGSNFQRSAYISINPKLGATDNQIGGIAFGTGNLSNVTEKMRITAGGNIGIGTDDPKGYLQIGTSSTTSKPLVIHNGAQSVIGYNWYWNGTDQFFNQNISATKIVLDGTFQVWNKRSNGPLVPTIYAAGGDNGRVGIRTNTPQVALDVNGDILSNASIRASNLVSAGTVSSDNISLAKRFELKYANNGFTSSTHISSDQFYPYTLTVNNFSVVRSNTQVTEFSHNVNIYSATSNQGNLTVDKNISSIRGNLTIGSGSITNYESVSQVPYNPGGRVYVYATGVNDFQPGNFVNISNFIYTASAYRVGALIHLTVDFTVGINATFSTASAEFYGLMFYLNSSRFKPKEHSYTSGVFQTSGSTPYYVPMMAEIFQTDPTGGSAPSSVNIPDSFYVRFRRLDYAANSTAPPNLFASLSGTPYLLQGTKYRATFVYHGY